MLNRFTWVDIAKGIGIILVVYGHVARGLFSAGLFHDTSKYYLIDNILYSFHMPLFFFLAGIFFLHSFSKKGVNLIFSKLDTLLYPFVLWTLIQGVIEVFLSKYTNGHITILDVFQGLLIPRAQFWFLPTLFIIFFINLIIYSIFMKFNFSEYWKSLFLLCFGLCLYAFKNVLPDALLIEKVANNLIYFNVGIFATSVIYLTSHKKLMVFLTGSLFLLFEFISFGKYTLGFIHLEFTIVFTALIGISFVIAISKSCPSFLSKGLSYIGANSFEIYLLHILCASGLRIAFLNLLKIDNVIIHLIGGVLVGVFLPLGFIKIFNKFRLKWLFKIPNVISFARYGHEHA